MNRKKLLQEIIESFISLQRSLQQRSASKHGLPHGQKAAFFIIASRQQINTKQLAETLHITPGAVTQLAESLVADGYVERSASNQDRRIINLQLTEKGKIKLRQMKQERLQMMLEVCNDTSDQDLQTFLNVMKNFINNIEERK